MDEKLSPEQRALDHLIYSEVAPSLYLKETIPLHHVLSTIYRADDAGKIVVEIVWEEDAILVSCSVNHHILLRLVRQHLQALTFVPDGWTIFFELGNDAYHLDSLSLIDARRRT